MAVERIHENGRYLLQRAYDSGITDPRELGVFMGQMEVESGGFRRLEEGMHYSARRLLEVFPGRNGLSTHEQAAEIVARGPEGIANAIYGGRWGARELGNTEEGDGWQFRGRGFVQLTGRSNYSVAAAALGVDVVNNPDLVGQPNVGANAAVHFWRENVVSRGAHLDADTATPRINAGRLHADQRRDSAERWQDELTPEVLRQLERGEISRDARDALLPPAPPMFMGPFDQTAPRPRGIFQVGDVSPQLDEGLFNTLRSSLAQAEQRIDKSWDDSSERLLASIYNMSRSKGFSGDDQLSVSFNQESEKHRAGELVLVHRSGATASADPFLNMSYMSTSDAILNSSHETMQQVLSREQDRTVDQRLAQQTDAAALAQQEDQQRTRNMAV